MVHDIHYPFLNSLIFNLDHHQIQSHLSQDKLVIPFVITLPPELGGSYTDKRCSIRYELQWYNLFIFAFYTVLITKQSSFLKSNDQIRSSKKTLLLYPNVSSLKSKDAIDLYVPILDSKLVWKSITIDFSLSRMVWMSGAPIYITVKINNPTRYTVSEHTCFEKKPFFCIN